MDELNNNIMEEVMKRLGAMASPAGECCKEDADRKSTRLNSSH